MTKGTVIVNTSIIGQIADDAETIDGRNIGQIKTQTAAYIDAILGNLPKALATMSKLDAEVAISMAFEQAITRKLWGANSLSVYVTLNGQKAIQVVNARDITKMLKHIVRIS